MLSSAARHEMQHFVLCFCPNKQEKPRLGLIVAKRKLALAVSRNRVRRIIRESFRKHQMYISGVDVLVIAKKSIKWSDFDQLSRVLDRQWVKLKAC